MPPSTAELAFARETTARLLEELAMQNYLFDLEPGEGEYVLTVECAGDGAWETTRVVLPQARVHEARSGRGAYRELLQELRERLGACMAEAAPDMDGPDRSRAGGG